MEVFLNADLVHMILQLGIGVQHTANEAADVHRPEGQITTDGAAVAPLLSI